MAPRPTQLLRPAVHCPTVKVCKAQGKCAKKVRCRQHRCRGTGIGYLEKTPLECCDHRRDCSCCRYRRFWYNLILSAVQHFTSKRIVPIQACGRRFRCSTAEPTLHRYDTESGAEDRRPRISRRYTQSNPPILKYLFTRPVTLRFS